MALVLVLANSRKLSGRCVAGIDLGTGRWVRPVGATPDGELVRADYLARFGSDRIEVRPGDIVDMALGESRRTPYHPEDVQTSRPWVLVERLSSEALAAKVRPFVERPKHLLGSAGDRLAISEIADRPDHCSLQLIHSESSAFYWKKSVRGTPQLRCAMTTGRNSLNLAVTDPEVERLIGATERRTIPNCLLTISLTLPFSPSGASEEQCFKIVAAVVQL
jgi:hypothetical protein